MLRPATRTNAPRCPRIWIADPRPEDYASLALGMAVGKLDIRFMTSGRELLRRWSACRPDACFVNVQLAGMNGFDLVEMLRPFPPGMSICLVGDCYRAADEVRALSLGVHHFLCKPLEGVVLSQLCACRAQPKACRR